MITYSTEFPIDNKNTIEDVIRLAGTWITGSQFSSITNDKFNDLPTSSEIQFSSEKENVTIGISQNTEFKIGGLRYTRIDKDDLEWTTSIVTTKTEKEHVLSVQISCEASNTASWLPSPKKPYFIRQVFSKLGGGMDGEIPIADKPIYLLDDEVKLAAELILGNASNRLPIVYISKKFSGQDGISAEKLSKSISGIAHVIVEPSEEFSRELKKICNSRNVYDGTIGVYWPDSNSKKSYYLTLANSEESIKNEITKDIRIALCNRRQSKMCNWLHLKDVLAKSNYEKLKSDGSRELDSYIEIFENDQKTKEDLLSEAESEISRLNAEIRKNNSTSASTENGIIQIGEEQNFYENEIFDIIIDALTDAKKNSLADSRRDHVLKDILKHNPPKSRRKTIQSEIKIALNDYNTMDAKTKSTLEKNGFQVTDDSRHHKATFHGDERYKFTISKTSSDIRSGKNLTSDINKKLF
ncbi:hypothetical protein LE191_27195 [Janthinobacterium sp. HSC-3S05]|uniref:hypothetical protein n=1 Tax=Janthinobacterium lividum TaxID=29581 RepID=UPI001CD85B18|nr:hypothetical protein [Janthinobacterium lividum]MCA1863805.1 hypothetical protein [Janthinobacterium lividum]